MCNQCKMIEFINALISLHIYCSLLILVLRTRLAFYSLFKEQSTNLHRKFYFATQSTDEFSARGVFE